MSWQDKAACINDDPREWDEFGSQHAHYVCREMCPVRTECLADARREKPIGQMRAGIPFGVGPTPDTYLQHERWYEMWLEGMSFKAIGRHVGKHHTTVMTAIRRIQRHAA